MGWKAFSILIKPAIDISHETILQALGFSDVNKIDDELYDVAIYPDKNKIFIGYYNNLLIISEFNLPYQFFTPGLTETEKRLINIFPKSEICAVSLHSGTNYWAYAIIKEGQKIRARMGDGSNGTTLDFGEPLEEELALLSKSRFDDYGQRQYFFEEYPEKPFSEAQVGENFVFEIYKRYTGERLDSNDDFLFETQLSGYEIVTAKKVSTVSQSIPDLITKQDKPWWKFW